MESMTGFASVQGSFEHHTFDILIRSVNSRFLEIKFHLGRELASFENELREQIQKFIVRGSVDVMMSRRKNALSPFKVNVNYLRDLKKTTDDLARSIGLSSRLEIRDLLQLAGGFDSEARSSPVLASTEKKFLLAQFDVALRKCVAERKREGSKLGVELQRLVKKIDLQMRAIFHLHERFRSTQKNRLRDRLVERLGNQPLDEVRLSQEVAFQMDRADIQEELTRLREHLSHFRNMLKAPESQGKKLDFYTQELHREVNTIGAKCQSAELTSLVVEAKSLVEQIREQVQNIA